MWPFKDKKQKCRSGPDCGWNMKPNRCDIFYNCKFNQRGAYQKWSEDLNKSFPDFESCKKLFNQENVMKKSEELQLKLNQLTAKKMTVSMKIANELAKVTKLEALEAERKALEFNIVETRNRVLAERMLEEKEQSAAGEWIDKRYGIKDEKLYFKAFPIKYPPPYTYLKSHMMETHEAGQKHGAEVEREKYKPLVELCKYMQRHYNYIFKQAKKNMTVKKFQQALKNLEENEPVSEEPKNIDPDSIGFISQTNQNGQGGRAELTIIVSKNTPLRIFDRVKLTPIKD